MNRHSFKTTIKATFQALTLIAFLTSLAGSSLAQSPSEPPEKDISAESGKILANIPIQNAGRIKPFDSFARFTLLSCYHKSKIDDLSASQWMAQLLLDPMAAYDVRCFRIKNEDLIDDLGLKKKGAGPYVYSFNELRTTIDAQRSRAQTIQQRDKKHRTLVEEQLGKLYSAVYNYFSISRSLTCLTPEFIINNEQLAIRSGTSLQKPLKI